MTWQSSRVERVRSPRGPTTGPGASIARRPAGVISDVAVWGREVGREKILGIARSLRARTSLGPLWTGRQPACDETNGRTCDEPDAKPDRGPVAGRAGPG